jgi:hypothetical protein
VLRRLRSAAVPPQTSALLRLFPRLQQVRHQRAQLRTLVRRARRFTPAVAADVAVLARSDPDAALATFVAAFQREHFQLDEAICDEGFDFWVEAAAEFIPLLLRGTDRCNGIEPVGFRPGYALMWALIEDVFFDDQRSEVIAEVAEAFGEALAERLAAADPPEHRVLRRRLARTPYAGMVAFSCWALGDVGNPVLFHHAHHADELLIPWTRCGVARAARLVRQADDFEAPILALARWLEHAPAAHGPLLANAALGRPDARTWSPAAIQPCPACGFPPAVRTRDEALGRFLLPDPALHRVDHTAPALEGGSA